LDSQVRVVAGASRHGTLLIAHAGWSNVDVLLVEDDELILDCLAEALNDAGLQTGRSLSAEAALVLMNVNAPKVVVTDINLGAGMDGLALGRATHAKWPSMPVVYISGRYAELRGLGTHERFLPKPFAAAALLRAIADVRHSATA
jgi:two-component system C4-dicarboxylate transport response regulator DctD